jgi:hypothetical protein
MVDMPDADYADDSTNLLEEIAAAKGEIQRFKSVFPKDSWDELRSTTRDALLQGVAALRGLQAAESPTSMLRYVNWFDVNSRAFLQTLNQLPECLGCCGGPLLESNAVLEQLIAGLDRVLVDLVLLAAKIKRGKLDPRQVNTESEETIHGHGRVEPDAQRLIRCLRSLAYDLDDEWENRLQNQLTRHLDGCICILLQQLAGMTKTWLITLVIELNTISHSSPCVSDDAEAVEFVTLDLPDGEIASSRFAYGDSVDELWRTILSKNRITGAENLAVPEEFVSAAGSGRVRVCHFCTTANPSALQDVCMESLNAVSGFLALLRTTAAEEWQREILSYTDSEDRTRLSVGDPSKAIGFAVPISEGMTSLTDPISPPEWNAGSIMTLSIPSMIVPLDMKELQRAQKLLEYPFLGVLIDSLRGQGKQVSMSQKLKKAFHFWSKAELRRAGLQLVQFTAWSLAELFLDYCMAIEILLGEKAEVVQIVSSRAAALLADDPDGRLKAFALVKSLYAKRSRYVHEGVASVRHSDVLDIRDVVRQCLLYALKWAAVVATIKFCQQAEKHQETVETITAAFDRGRITPSEEQLGNEFFDALFGHADRFGRHCDGLRFGTPRLRFDTQECIERVRRELGDRNESE